MQETPEDIARLQGLLDDSYARAGAHLSSIHTPEARLSAEEVCARLYGMQIFVVATTTQDGRPRTGPVDTFLYRGELRFGTAPNAVRARHLARSPAVSATHVRGETLVVTVHGRASRLDLGGVHSDFAGFLRGHYGPTYDAILVGGSYFGISAEWLFAADMSVHTAASSDGR